jgi:hypothetical protein
MSEQGTEENTESNNRRMEEIHNDEIHIFLITIYCQNDQTKEEMGGKCSRYE